MSSATPTGPHARLRPRTTVLFGVVAALFVGAVLLRTPVPLFAALPLLLAPLAAAASAPALVGAADLRWEAAGLGPDLALSGSITGAFGSSADNIELILPAVPGTIVRRAPKFDRSPSEIRFSMAWTLAEPTITRLEAPRVVWRDPLGLFEEELPGTRPPLDLERYPPELHRLGTVRLDRTLQLPGESRSRRLGPSGEFFGIRDAAIDEPPRSINWRASARAGRLLANDFQVDRTGDVLLLLDVRATSYGPALDERMLGIARAGVFGIAESLLRNKVRVGYASFGEFVYAVPLASGRAHRIRIKEAVLGSRRSEVTASPERCTFGLRRFFRPGITTLVVSNWPGDRAYELLPYLQRAGYPSIMVSPSPLSLLEEPTALPFEARVARRLERADRRARLARLWAHGPVVDWTDFWSLDGLAHFLRQPTRRRVS